MSTPTLDATAVRRWKRYPEYRSTADAWLIRLPAGWASRRLKLLFREVDERVGSTEMPLLALTRRGLIPRSEVGQRASESDDYSRYKVCRPDMVVMNKMQAWNGAFALANVTGMVSPDYTVLRATVPLSPSYFTRLFTTALMKANFSVRCRGMGDAFFRLNTDDFGDVTVPLPPLPDQRVIAAFLDRETVRVDALIERKERLVALLEEKRQAVISHAVTRGLDPASPLKDSGVPWLDKIPSHWDVRRLKHISPRQLVGVVVNPSSYLDDQGEIPFLFGSNILPGRISLEGVRRITADGNKLIGKSILNTADLVTVRVGAPGVTAVIPQELDGCNCASIMITRCSPRFHSDWLCFAMNSSVGKTNVELAQYGAAQEQFNISHAVDFIFPVPPLAEQVAIAEHLRSYSASADRANSRIRDGIVRLHEYRTALISAAVTGQIDVRGEVHCTGKEVRP